MACFVSRRFTTNRYCTSCSSRSLHSNVCGCLKIETKFSMLWTISSCFSACFPMFSCTFLYPPPRPWFLPAKPAACWEHTAVARNGRHGKPPDVTFFLWIFVEVSTIIHRYLWNISALFSTSDPKMANMVPSQPCTAHFHWHICA